VFLFAGRTGTGKVVLAIPAKNFEFFEGVWLTDDCGHCYTRILLTIFPEIYFVPYKKYFN
jgi:hypothetical protein